MDQPTELEQRISRAICRHSYGAEDMYPRNTDRCRRDGKECVVGDTCIWWVTYIEKAQGAIKEFEKCPS